MKSALLIGISLIVALLAAFLAIRYVGFTQEIHDYTTTISLTGTEGATFTGYYIAEGKRIDVSDVLPWTVSAYGISECEFRKTDPNASMKIEACGGYSTIFGEANPNANIGFKLDMVGGWSFTSVL